MVLRHERSDSLWGWPSHGGVSARSRRTYENPRARHAFGRAAEYLAAGYLQRQEADIRAFRRDEALLLPEGLDYQAVPGLSNEARQVVADAGPATLGAAARLPGMTPAALVTLLRYVRRGRGSAPGQGEEHAA